MAPARWGLETVVFGADPYQRTGVPRPSIDVLYRERNGELGRVSPIIAELGTL